MFKKFVQLSAMAAATQAADVNQTLAEANSAAEHWAVIVVGSRGYMNYRHHADGCHAYHIAKENGIPQDQIILIAYDDVAQSGSNPYRGKLFNKPTKKGTPGVDVYEGCKIDYKGSKANKETVLGVLKGDTSVGHKVVKSNQNSKVFFYFADHGAPGLVAMPTGKYLMADELHNAVKYMHENKMYKEMVMYIEACESGSMFEKTKYDDLNVYAVSAANGHESSWGTYCSPDDEVNGKHIGSCLGDLFSVNWMEDTDKAIKAKRMGTETLETQYDTIKRKTTRSHVLQWGDMSFTSEPIGNFQAGTFNSPKDFWSTLKGFGKDIIKNKIGWEDADTARKNDFAVDVRDIKLHYLYTQVLHNPNVETQKALMDELDHRLKIDQRFEKVFPTFNIDVRLKNYPLPQEEADFDCYRHMINIYTESCGEPDTYTMKYFGSFLHQCNAIKYYPNAVVDYKEKIFKACNPSEQMYE